MVNYVPEQRLMRWKQGWMSKEVRISGDKDKSTHVQPYTRGGSDKERG